MAVELMKEEVRLTPAAWNRNRFKVCPIQSDGKWSEQVSTAGLVIDLSLVEWVDFGALAQVVLFVHNASCSGIRVDILLPDKRDHSRITIGDLDESSPERTARRIRVYDFLTYMQFPEALLHAPELPQWVAPRVLDGDLPYIETKTREKQTLTYSTIVPLSWVDHNKPASLEQFTKFFSAAISNGDSGLTSEDAKALANTIIFELVENVFTHAGGSGLALVSAWSRRKDQRLNEEDYFKEEQKFILSTQRVTTSIVEIFVGDAGKGIVNTLESAFVSNEATPTVQKKKRKVNPHDVIHWAFDRWSSRKTHIDIEKRGVRGLFRVASIAKRYRGLISVQSDPHFQARDYSTHGKIIILNQTHPYAFTHGTLLRLRLPVTGISFSKTIAKSVQSWNEKAVFIDKNSELISLGSIGENGIDNDHKNKFFEHIKLRREYHGGAVYIVFHGAKYHKHGIEKALTFLAQNSAPNAVAIFGLYAHDVQLQTAVDSVNETVITLKEQHHKDYQRLGPLLVFSNTGAAFWVGVTSHQKTAYETIMQNPGISYSELIIQLNCKGDWSESESLELDRLLHEYHTITQVKVMVNTGENVGSFCKIEQLAIRMNKADFLQLAANAVLAPLQVENTKINGVTKQSFLTPSLKVVNTWIDLPHYLEENQLMINGYSAMVALALKIQQSKEFEDGMHALLSDTSATPKFRNYFGSFLGLGSEQIIDAEEQKIDAGAARTQGMGKRVIVYADLIASSETAKRTIVHALRQGYVVIAIACVLDTRIKPGEPLQVWGMNIPVIALANHLTELEDGAQYSVIKSPLGEDELPSTELPTKRSEIHQLIMQTRAVSLGHAIRPNGRHLTFTIKPKALLEHVVVLEKLHDATTNWLSGFGSDASQPVDVWTPVERENSDIWGKLVDKAFRPAVGCRDFAVTRFRKLDSYETTHFKRLGGAVARDKHVIVFDWGAITGASITQLMRRAVDEGALSVLAIVILSQMEAEDAAFLSKVSELTTIVPGKQLDLLTFSQPETNKSTVKIQWLESFSMGHYASTHCPICARRREFEETNTHTEYLQQFRDAEIERMKPRAMRDVPEPSEKDPNYNNDFFDAIQISDFRQQLHAAYSSTVARLKISEEITHINIALQSPTPAALTSACTLVTFIASEPNWLKRAPLHFRPIRKNLSNICESIAVNSNIPDNIRSISIQVLRMVSKVRYTKEFKTIIQSCAEKNVGLLQPLLYGVHTILKRGYHEHLGLLEPLKMALEDGKCILDSQPNQEELWPAKSTLDHLGHVCEFFLRRIGKSLISEQSAYECLSNLLGSKFTQHSPPVKGMDLLKSSSVRKTLNCMVSKGRAGTCVTQDEFKSVEPWLRNCKEYWSVCLAFLEHNLIPHLRLIQNTFDIHTSPTITTPKQDYDTFKLLELISRYDDSGYPDNEITDSVEILSGRLSITDFANPIVFEAWRVFNDEIDWYEKMFFNPNRGSDLARRIADIPATLKIGFENGLRDREFASGLESYLCTPFVTQNLSELDVDVYCPREVLKSLFTEVFRNMESHSSHSDCKVQYMVDVCNADENVVLVTITNNSTVKFDPTLANQGHILTYLKADIEKFGGALEFGEPLFACLLPEPTFYIKVTLCKWKGH